MVQCCSASQVPRTPCSVWKSWTPFALFTFFFLLWCCQHSHSALSFPFALLSCSNVSYPGASVFFSLCWPVLLTVSLLLTPLLAPSSAHHCCPWVSLHPVSARFHPGLQLRCFQLLLLPPPFPHVFPNALLLACYVWLAGFRVRVKCQYNFFFLPVLKECHGMEFEYQKIHFCWEGFNLPCPSRH